MRCQSSATSRHGKKSVFLSNKCQGRKNWVSVYTVTEDTFVICGHQHSHQLHTAYSNYNLNSINTVWILKVNIKQAKWLA